MEGRDELLFLLSSPDRVGLLSALEAERMRLSKLSSKLSMTVQETSRQLARLQAADLVQRDSQGLFALTNYRRIALKILPSFDFLAGTREYLLTHGLSSLPSEFVERIGELSKNEQGRTLGDTLKHFQEVMDGATKFIWLMADQVLLLDSVAETVKSHEKVSVRIVVPRAVAEEAGETALRSEFQGRLELGLVDDVRVGMALNESLAGLIFPDNSGKTDFDSGLRGSDTRFRCWCNDLFLFHWSRARKREY